MGKVHVEKPTNANRIEILFDYDAAKVKKVRDIPGRRWVKERKINTAPLDMPTCRHLRELFGTDLIIGPNLRTWAMEQNRLERQLGSISTASTYELERLQTVLPRLYRALYVGPLGIGKTDEELDAMMAAAEQGSYQTADVAFLTHAPNPLNGNQPGLGKTLETIGAIYERYESIGKVLVVAPRTSLESVWGVELAKWQHAPVFVAEGTKKEREETIAAFVATKGDAWLIVNQEMVRLRKDPTNTGKHAEPAKTKDWDIACKCDRLKDPHWHYLPPFPDIQNTAWTAVIVDECHKGAIRNSRTITAKSLNALALRSDGKRMALSGTPMKNSAIDLWGVLHWLNPKEFTSLWNWAARWCEIEQGDYGKRIGPLREDRKEELYRTLTPYVLRRTKAECAPWLPPKHVVSKTCYMTPNQRKQYEEMNLDAMAEIGGTRITAVNVLSEFLRLKQFAIAAHTMRNGKMVPTEDSCKLAAMDELLAERGIFDVECEEKVVVFSQFEEVVSLVVDHLRKLGVEVVTITGKVNKKGERAAIQQAFQKQGGARVIVMTTTAGGVSITLDAADTAIFMDEWWSPADQEQAEDRIHRVSRIHQVTIYYLRTEGTIDDYVMETVSNKAQLHKEVLDIRRQMLAA